jgi:hypothetical protein
MRALALRPARSAALAALSLYCFMLLAAALPSELLPVRALTTLKLGAGYALHLVGITPGLAVFDGKESLHAIHHMTCFRVVAEGERQVVLYDDLVLCRQRRVEPIRDPFRGFQMRRLSAAFVELNLKGHGKLTHPLLQPLFLFSDYYCHTPAAEHVRARRVSIEAYYIGLNLRDGTTGEVPMRGSRDCSRTTWAVNR